MKNPNGKNTAINGKVDKFIVNEQEIEEKELKLDGAGGVYNIEVIL